MPMETEKQETGKDETVRQETSVVGTGWVPILVGCVMAFLLHATVWCAVRMAAGIYERMYDRPHVFSTNPTWTVLWGLLTLALCWRCKPRLVAWGAPFTLCVAFWFFIASVAVWHPDTPEEEEVALFCYDDVFGLRGSLGTGAGVGAGAWPARRRASPAGDTAKRGSCRSAA